MPVPQTLSDSVERYGLQHIRPRHEEIARRLVLGQTQTEIAAALKFTACRLSIIVNSPLFKVVLRKLAKLRDDSTINVKEELDALQPIALDQVARTAMNSPSESLRLKASMDLLDRGGNPKTAQSTGVQINIVNHPVDLSQYEDKPESEPITVEATVVEKPNNGGESSVQAVNDSNKNTEEEDTKLLDEALKPIEEPEEEKSKIEQLYEELHS